MTSIPPHPEPHQTAEQEGSGARPGADPAESARQVVNLLKQLMDMASFWVATRLDRLKLKVIQLVIIAVCAIIALLVALVAVIVATVYVMNALAGLIAELAGHRPWVGYGVVGLLLLGFIAGGAWIGYRKIVASLGSSMADKYASWRKTQSDRFGDSLGN